MAINKNDNPAIELFVMDDSGNIMDGTPGNESGSRILAIIPGASDGIRFPREYVDTNVAVVVTNPIRNSPGQGLSSEEIVMVKFTEVKEEKAAILQVSHRMCYRDGGETVTVSGSNFAQDVKVFIDGRKFQGYPGGGW